MRSYKGTLQAVRNTQRLMIRAAGLPSPPSRDFAGTLRNFCPVCDSTAVAGPPWECSTCGWKAKNTPAGCCRRINAIRKCGKEYALSIEGADPDDPKLMTASKGQFKQAVDNAVEIDESELGDEVADE